MGFHPQYFERTAKQWTRYDGFRIKTAGWRCVVFDHKNFDREGRVFAYAWEDGSGTFGSYYEIPEPGETRDVECGLHRTLADAKRSAVEGCVREMDEVHEVMLRERSKRGRKAVEQRGAPGAGGVEDNEGRVHERGRGGEAGVQEPSAEADA